VRIFIRALVSEIHICGSAFVLIQALRGASAAGNETWITIAETRMAVSQTATFTHLSIHQFANCGGTFMSNSARKHLGFAAILVSLAALAGTASAETTWQKNHPRRTQVNHRLANQDKRIHQDVKNGSLSKSQAANLHHEDHQVRQEERDMASQNGGHITKPEQKVLNGQENNISGQIPPK
jgi:uncharacterized protein HemX